MTSIEDANRQHPAPRYGARVPPSDLQAEESLLGAMLLSRQAIPIALQSLLAKDFYKPAHAAIFAVIETLYQESQPVDPVTVADELKRRGELSSIGGAPALVSLQAGTPSTSNAGTYAKIIYEHATMRGLIAAAGEIAELGYSMAEPDTAVAKAKSLVGGLAVWTPDAPPDAGYEHLLSTPDVFDWVSPELFERGDRVIITGKPGSGKALALDTPIPTTSGWRTMGTMRVGDEVFGPDGTPRAVTHVSEVMFDHQCYRVEFSDGSSVVADAEHLWLTETKRARLAEANAKKRSRKGPLKPRGTDQRHKRVGFPSVVTTEHIRETLIAPTEKANNHSIDAAKPVQYPTKALPIDPYVLGVWLGDGSSRSGQIATDDGFVVEEFRRAGYTMTKTSGLFMWGVSRSERIAALMERVEVHITQGGSERSAARLVGLQPSMVHLARRRGRRRTPSTYGLTSELRKIGLLCNKQIPAIYLESDVQQRLALLQGLMDSDGTVDKKGRCEFSVTDERLARNALELVRSLGIVTRLNINDAKIQGRYISKRYRVAFNTTLPVFRLPRKAERLPTTVRASTRRRYITAVTPVESVPVRCIKVANEDGLFLANESFITTHNTTFALQIAVQVAAGFVPFSVQYTEPRRVVTIDLENGARYVKRTLRGLTTKAATLMRPVPSENLIPLVRAEGINLLNRADALWLIERCEANRPDLLVIGPAYKLHGGDPSDEEPAREVAALLDRIRERYECALLIEAHSPHNDPIGRPYGASLWTRWPEFGMNIHQNKHANNYLLRDWRGPRAERQWPKVLRRGGRWMWDAADSVPREEP